MCLERYERHLSHVDTVVELGVELRDRARRSPDLAAALVLDLGDLVLGHLLNIVQDALTENIAGFRICLHLRHPMFKKL